MEGTRNRPDACAWCGKDASQRLVIRKGAKVVAGYRPEKTAPACEDCAKRVTRAREPA